MISFLSNTTGIVYKNLMKPVLFSMDPENVHDRFTEVGNFLGKHKFLKSIFRATYRYDDPILVQKIHGITFTNPVGLSAGFDKDANLVNILPDIGFGYTQVGTVTYEAYEGNPKPRLYRLPNSKGLVVYYGLKNIGAEKVIKKLKKNRYFELPISISVGKTNCSRTSKEAAGIKDYADCMAMFEKADIGDFYTINISCPNTFGGEPFTTAKSLDSLLKELVKIKTKKPIYIKMPINLEWKEFEKLVKVAVKYKINGLIIGNLNKNHDDAMVKDYIPKTIKGGISGKPTWHLSNELISQTYKKYGDKITIVGVGGIFSAEDAYEKIKRGASLVQLITGMVYGGPQLIGQINKRLGELARQDGYSNISDAVGKYHS